ncbi:MAG: NACHT domain-containing protein [Oscillochloridaceae bacterium umkhey_bin13]
MPHDLATTIQQLRSLHATGLLDDDELEQKLARLREKHGAAAVDAALAELDLPVATQASAAPLAPPDAPQAPITVSGQTGDISIGDVVAGNQQKIEGGQVGVAVAGNLYGHVFIGGQRTQSATALLHAYLQRVIASCDALPLQAFRDKQDLHDQVALSLEQVYTELATNAEPALRERVADEALRQLDVAAFWEAHVGAAIMPWQRRITLIRPLLAEERQSGPELRMGQHEVSAERSTRVEGRIERLEELGLERLNALASQVPWLQFTGPQLVTEALATHQRLVLLGEPGSGKSTALRFLALSLARAATDASLPLADRLPGWPAADGGERLLPILMPLLPFAKYLAENKLAAAGSADLWNYIASQLGERGRYQGLAEAVHSELEAGRVLVMLDGLDEVAGEASRHLVVQAVTAFAREYRTCRMVISCRVRAYEGAHNAAWQLPGWPSETLADWTPSQMQHFVAAWYAAVGGLPPDECERRRADLQEALARRSDLQRLGVRPLLLTIMALVHYNDSKLPEERAALYSRCVDILLARWELGRTLSGYASAYGTLMDYIGLPDADVKTLRPLLQQAAFLAHCAATPESLGSLTRNDLHMLVADALKDRHPNPHAAAGLFWSIPTPERACSRPEPPAMSMSFRTRPSRNTLLACNWSARPVL